MDKADRQNYCKDCDRSIYSTSENARTCDCNIEDNGYYNLAGDKCYCKVVNGKRAEKYPWENQLMYNTVADGCIQDLLNIIEQMCSQPDVLNNPIEYGVKLGIQTAINIIEAHKKASNTFYVEVKEGLNQEIDREILSKYLDEAFSISRDNYGLPFSSDVADYLIKNNVTVRKEK